ncbi:MAG: HNH endonuclease [Gammaproteobacteria bacterium]|nr:HNH endonuclease [Gammaproteobacteria bacterium]
MPKYSGLELPLRASADAWRLFSARKADVNFKHFEDKILIRDAYTCRFCGFQAKNHQEIVNVDGNFRNNKIDNLVTACVFCTQCFFIESIGLGGVGGGIVVYLPEISQNQLNAICHVLFCAITNNSGYKNIAQNIYLNLKMRSSVIEKKYGEGTSDPANFGYLLVDSKHFSEEKINEMISPIRLLPSRAKFRTQIESWASTAINEVTNVMNPVKEIK